MRALLASIAVASVAVPAAATAQPSAEATAVVAFGDLNLASPAGMAALKARVKAAAYEICGPYDFSPTSAWRSQAQCKKAVIESADRQIATIGRFGTGIQLAAR